MAKQNNNQNQNQNEPQNPNPNQTLNPNQVQNPNRNPPPPMHGGEDFNLTETRPSLGGGRISGFDRGGTAFDLVEQMEYLYVRVVKARGLPGTPDPFVEVKLGGFKGSTRTIDNTTTPEWNHVFSILKDHIQTSAVEILVKSKPKNGGDPLLGTIAVDAFDVPRRVPPDSPLAPEWYRMDNGRGERAAGELMFAVWMGTQADEAFSEAWHLDAAVVNGDGIRSKVYLSPRLWYLRLNVIEAHELPATDRNLPPPEISVRAQLGNMVLRTRTPQTKFPNPLWNEDLLFTVAEPFEEQLLLYLEAKTVNNKTDEIGHCSIPLQGVEKRVDFKPPASRWYNLQKTTVSDNGQRNGHPLNTRVHLRLSLDGGYHVLDELTQYSSDLRPTARTLWKPTIGVLELGILNARNLAGMKTKDGLVSTDAYCVAKYGPKWIRTRTILNTLDPKWNEQYTWEVFDPCTVITVAVFDNSQLTGGNGKNRDSRIGKVRIRLSTLETNRVYTHLYPLIVLTPAGVRKMGEIQLAVRFSCVSLLNMLSMYSQPLLPTLHYLRPLSCHQVEVLRHQAAQVISTRLSRAEPPLRKEAIEYMLDVGSNMWSFRRSKANHYRIARVLSFLVRFLKWLDEICTWKNRFTTVLVHFFFLAFISFPWMIFSMVFLYMFMIGVWNYRLRPRHPPHMDVRMSQADVANVDELDEEFDSFPTSQNQVEVLKARYDRLRAVGSRVQTVLGDLATQGERVYNLLSWRDPRATALFMMFCFVSCVVLYLAHPKVVVAVVGFYAMRHPKFRDRMPGPGMSFLRRLPAKSDCLL